MPARYATRTLPDWSDATPTPSTASPTVESVNAAVDLIAAGAALGLTLPTPPGLTVWAVECYAFDELVATLGPYSTREAAQAGLRDWVLVQWEQGDSGPWSDSEDPTIARTAWLADHDDEAICATYAAQYSGESQEIVPGVVLPAPARNL